MATGDAANPDIQTPKGLSASAREELIERARYEVFKNQAENTRTVKQLIIMFIALGTMIAGVSVWVVPLLGDSSLVRILFVALVGGGGGAFASYLMNRQRARLINTKIRELAADSSLTK